MPSVYADDPVRERIAALINAMAPVPAEALTRETDLVDELGYDSLTVVELLFEFEREFGTGPLREDAAAEATTVGEVVELLLTHVNVGEHA